MPTKPPTARAAVRPAMTTLRMSPPPCVLLSIPARRFGGVRSSLAHVVRRGASPAGAANAASCCSPYMCLGIAYVAASGREGMPGNVHDLHEDHGTPPRRFPLLRM